MARPSTNLPTMDQTRSLASLIPTSLESAQREVSMTLQYWFMFPISVLIATVAMGVGVGGATFFAPLFILALGLPPEVAIGTGLITEVFGFASGIVAYARRRLIDYKLGFVLLSASVPMAVLGAWVAGFIDPGILKAILGIGLFAVATSFLRTPDKKRVSLLDRAIKEEYGEGKSRTCVTTADGERICYTVCNRFEGMATTGLGGLFVGMISTGLGEVNEFFLLKRCRVPSRVSIATTVFVVAVTALAGSAGHVANFLRLGGETLTTVLSIVLFTVPGVILGGQFGARVSSLVPQRISIRVMGVLFAIVGALTLGEAILR